MSDGVVSRWGLSRGTVRTWRSRIAARPGFSRAASVVRILVVMTAVAGGGSQALQPRTGPAAADPPTNGGTAEAAPLPSEPSPGSSPLASAPAGAIPGPSIALLPPPFPPPTPSPTVEPEPLKVVRFGPGTPRQFLALVRDMSIDVIEIAGGTYRNWHVYIDVDRTRPLLVRPAPGADVVWDAKGSRSGDGLFYLGYRRFTSDISFDPVGTGGSFTIQNYELGQQGLVDTFWVDRVTFNGFRTTGISGLRGGSLSWTVYVSSDGVHRGRNITVNDWRVGPSAGRTVGGLQTYHNPQARGIQALRWRITGASSAMTLYGDAAGIDIQGWRITDCEYAVYSDGNAAGILKDNVSTGSGAPPLIRGRLVDGTGNSWR